MSLACLPYRGRAGRLFADYCRHADDFAARGFYHVAKDLRCRGREYAIALLLERHSGRRVARHIDRINRALCSLERSTLEAAA